MIKSKGNIVIKFEKRDEEFVDNFEWDRLREGYTKARDFFEREEDIIPLRICFLYSPEEFLFFSGYSKYEEWMMAFTGNNNTIYIFSPSVIEKYTVHKKEDMLQVLIHEIAHFFYDISSINGNLARFSLWNEGIADYIADKKHENKNNLYLTSLSGFGEFSNNYSAGYTLIKSIMDYLGEKGNKKIIEFLNIARENDDEEALSEKFEKVFGKNPNELIKENSQPKVY